MRRGWTVGVKAVLRPEPAVKEASWPSRLLDGLGGLGGWLVGPDPGLNRLRVVLCAMVTIAGAIGAEWLFVHFTGALLRPAPPAAAGADAAVRVAAANHALLIFAMVLGGVIGLTAAISVQDTQPRDQVVSMLVLPVPMIAVLALSLAVAPHRVLALCLLPLILAAGTYPRRFGPAGVRVAPLLFTGYLFGFLLGSVITLGDTGWLTAEIGVGIVVAIVVKVGVFHDTSSRALRRTQRSYAARARRLAGLALAAFDEPGPSASRRLYRHKTRLGEATQLIDGQLADPGVAQGDSAAALLHQRLFDSWLALGNLARFAAALGRSPLHAGQREQVREILASLRDGRFDSARASALAFAETLTAPADPDGDNTEIIAHRFAGSVTDFTDALSQWLELGARDQPTAPKHCSPRRCPSARAARCPSRPPPPPRPRRRPSLAGIRAGSPWLPTSVPRSRWASPSGPPSLWATCCPGSASTGRRSALSSSSRGPATPRSRSARRCPGSSGHSWVSWSATVWSTSWGRTQRPG